MKFYFSTTYFLCLNIFLIALSSATAQKNYYTTTELENFQTAANNLATDTSLAFGDIGILVQDAETAQTLASVNAKKV